ncbi:MAG TPA: DNA translocase FtsK 4TM domain-containing protein [Chitinophagaceae bacterium]|nr:DNA translocase FtsK 4TM domain-containing protein [Chitinophagaceae bacterium]
MANKLKKTSKKNTGEKPKKTVTDLKPEKEEKIDLKKLAGDERTWKIAGAFLVLISLFLFISFISYFFTWQDDQSQVLNHSIFDSAISAKNLLGVVGAFVSYFFIYKGFGIASFFICTFFFVVGVNFLFSKRVFSVWRNLRYVVVGVLVISVSLAFLFANSGFAFGGSVGTMISNWLVNMLGNIGTAALLLVAFLAYIIWQFNPVFRIPKKPVAVKEEDPKSEEFTTAGKTVNELYADNIKGNSLKGEAKLFIVSNEADKPDPITEFKIIERDEEAAKESFEDALVSKEVVADMMHQHDISGEDAATIQPKIKRNGKSSEDLELEIKSPTEEELKLPPKEKTYEDLPPYEPTLDLRDYKYPRLDLLESHGGEKIVQDPSELEENKNQIITTLKNYDIAIQKISATVGPTVTLYEIVPAAGVRISRIKNLEDDIALSLAALGIRIIAPIPGKGTIGIEVPNVKKSIVSMRTLLASDKFQHNNYSLPIAIGKKIDNENFIVDLASMPHLLMAGATGQGKSVGINAILVSLLYKKHPSQLKFVLIDPKKVELSLYNKIEKHFLAKLPGEEDAIITDTKKVINTLNALCIEMDNRYDLLKEAGARNIREYNEKFVKRRLNPQKGHQYLPFIVLVIDEFADMIMTAGKEIEMPIARLAQLARAVGIHLIIATQRPSVNIITGTIKANFPSRIAFKVSSKIDSRTILDAGGAEQLIGKGDMLISHHGEITRLQCAFVDTPEVEEVVEFIGDQRGYPQAFLLPEYVDEKELEGKDFDLSDRDPLFEDAARLIVQNQVGSTSLLQRRMKLGYNRAGRLMDQLEAFRIVGPSQGSKARDVLIKTESELNEILQTL